MAGSKKTRNTGKRNTKGSAAAKNTRQASGQGFQTEMILILVLGATALMVISNLGMGGFVGSAISSFLFGAFGMMSFVFPFFFFLTAVFLMANRKNSLAKKKIFAAWMLFLILCGLMQLLTEGYLASASLDNYYQVGVDYHTGGGIVGGAICISTVSAFGTVGSYVIIALMLLVCLINLTQKSFFGFFYKLGDLIKAGMSSRRENYEEREPEREMKRELREKERSRRRREKQAVRMQRLEEAIAREDAKGTGAYERSFEVPVIEKTEPESVSERKKRPAAKKKKKVSIQQLAELEELLDSEETGERTQKISEPITFSISRSTMLPDPEETFGAASVTDKKPEAAAGNYREDVQEEMSSGEKNRAAKEEISPEPEGNRDMTEEMQPETKKRQSVRNPKSSRDEIDDGIQDISKEIQKAEPPRVYQYPPLKLLKRGEGLSQGDSDEELRKTATKLQEILETFGVHARVTNVCCGPTVTQYELQPEMGVKVSRIVNLADDIKLNLATPDIRIEAPIPGKAAVGIEVPNKKSVPVMLRDLLQSRQFQEASSKMSFAVGKNIAGEPVIGDIAKMPHLLIAGSTGSGKSVCINTIICSLLYKASPDDVKLIMVDPKVVELSVYNGIPHLLIPVVTDPKKAAGALNWAVTEMMNRYNVFAEYTVRNIGEYNRKIEKMDFPEGEERPQKMPQILIIVDELADLMMVAPGEVEDAIVRLTQLARAAGIHLIIATQRPSVNVITGLIKANMPSRIAFAVSSGVDSRTILDTVGAEKLLGHGDMLYYPQGYSKPARLQGSFVSDDEVSAIVAYITDKNPKKQYDAEIEDKVNTAALTGGASQGGAGADAENGRDPYFAEAGKFIIDKDKASIGMLQRMFRIGFNRAARIMDQLCEAGVVGPEEGTKPRKILMSMEEFDTYLEEYV